MILHLLATGDGETEKNQSHVSGSMAGATRSPRVATRGRGAGSEVKAAPEFRLPPKEASFPT